MITNLRYCITDKCYTYIRSKGDSRLQQLKMLVNEKGESLNN